MGLFDSLLKTGITIVTAPIEVVKDAATLGGLATGQGESYTERRLRKIAEDVEETAEEVADL